MTIQSAMNEALALDNCDQEPIHIPGRIQPFGCLLAGPADLSNIEYVSANTDEMLGLTPKELLGSSFADALGSDIIHAARNLLSYSTSRTQRERVGITTRDGDVFEVFIHLNPNQQAVLELEPVQESANQGHNPTDRMRIYLAKAAEQSSVIELLKICVMGLRELTGYDRVKAYRYFSNGDGEVVAEAHGVGVESFLGLRYPAWDVPAQARALQIKNPLRMLSDIRQSPVPLLALEESLPPLDISLAHLRGISPIHVEYLENMGVGATMTLGIVIDGKLWGMFSCHHLTPKVISSDLRISVELFAQLISLIIQQKLELEKSAARQRAGDARRKILAETDATTDLLHAFPDYGPILQDVIDCDGLAVLRDGKVQTIGSVPSMEAIRELGARLPEDEDLLDGTDSLMRSDWLTSTDLNDSAGCLQVRCTAAFPLQLMFFRDSKTRNLTWAGKPEKQIATGKFGTRLTPRGSFAAFKQEQDGYARDWVAPDFQAGRELQVLLTQITARGERAKMERHKDLVTHQRQQDLMIAELNHRVKNILALIRSLSRQAKSSSASLESYAQALEQRIAALASAHDLAVSNNMQGVSFRGILETELQPYVPEDNSQVILNGPLTGLRADVAPMIALVIHELVTNAAKYGALSTKDGIVQAKWDKTENGLTFSWRELGGPDVVEPSRHGFGRSLIEKAIPYEFDGKATLAYPKSGVTFDFFLPADTLSDVEEGQEAKLLGRIGKIKTAASDADILLVEDNIVLAMDMVDGLTRLGAKHVATAGTVEEALKILNKSTPDFAVLDLNLRGVVSFDIARRLIELERPFIFVTGYGSSVDMPEDMRQAQVLTKPIDDGSLSKAISRIYTVPD